MTENTNTITAPSTPAPVARLAYDRKQAAEALGISVRKLDELTADRDSGLPVARIGRKVLFPVDRLTAWFHNRIGATA